MLCGFGTKMGMEEQNVECVDWLINTSFSITPILVVYYDNPYMGVLSFIC